jgi:hypothetical protein
MDDNPSSLDTSSFPIMRLDQISLMPDQLLVDCLLEIVKEIRSLRVCEGEGMGGLLDYSASQYKFMIKERQVRYARSQVERRLKGEDPLPPLPQLPSLELLLNSNCTSQNSVSPKNSQGTKININDKMQVNNPHTPSAIIKNQNVGLKKGMHKRTQDDEERKESTTMIHPSVSSISKSNSVHDEGVKSTTYNQLDEFSGGAPDYKKAKPRVDR